MSRWHCHKVHWPSSIVSKNCGGVYRIDDGFVLVPPPEEVKDHPKCLRFFHVAFQFFGSHTQPRSLIEP